MSDHVNGPHCDCIDCDVRNETEELDRRLIEMGAGTEEPGRCDPAGAPHVCSLGGDSACCEAFRNKRRAELRRPGATETAIQGAIVAALRARGVWVIRTGVAVKRGGGSAQAGEGGMPDLCLPRFGWLEVKKGNGRLSPAQIAWHEKARRQGVRVATVRTVLEALETVASWEKAAA